MSLEFRIQNGIQSLELMIGTDNFSILISKHKQTCFHGGMAEIKDTIRNPHISENVISTASIQYQYLIYANAEDLRNKQ